ncbi:MAG: trigger factor [Lachnospiraceae bacterium]|nr:trigger factor [Lachnospiraceae bacterium]
MSNYAKRKQVEAEARKKEIKRTTIIAIIAVAVVALFVGILIFLRHEANKPVTKNYGDPNYNVFDYVTLGDYEGIEVYKVIPEVTDEQVQSKIDAIIKEGIEYTDLAEGDEVAEGDEAVIDFVGVLEGEEEPFEGGSATDQSHTLGDGSMIPGFDEGIYGMKIGETKDINVTFPEDYGNPDYAGKNATFTIVVKSAKRVSFTPEWNDEYVNKYTKGEYTTVADYEAKIRADLLETATSSSEQQFQQDLWAKVVANAKVDGYPNYVFNKQYDECYSQIQQYASMFNLTVDDYLKTFGGGIDFPTYVMNQVNAQLVREALIKTIPGIEMTADELKEAVKADLDTFNVATYEEAIANYTEANLRSYYESKKLQDYLQSKAVVKEVTSEEYEKLNKAENEDADAEGDNGSDEE